MARIKKLDKLKAEKELEEFAGSADSEVKETEEAKAEIELTETERNKAELKRENLLSCGSAILNLACSDNPYGAFIAGRYYLIVGSSSAGKTWIALTTCAEATLHPKFKDYRIILNEPEEGNNVDLTYYFSENVAKRIEAPSYDSDGMPIYSDTIEEFYDDLNEKLDWAEENNTGIIYVLDSMDALTSEPEIKKVDEQRNARAKGKETTGSMGDGKAKINSANLRRVCTRLAKSNSMLFIICQERDNLGSMVPSKTFSGGNALLFYATLQIWLQHKDEITATIKGRKRTLGNLTKVSVKKNRLTGQRHKDVFIPFYHSFGIDDTGSVIDWLVEEGYWEGGKSEISKIKAVDFEVELPKEKLARHIEDLEDGRQKLYRIVRKVWKQIKDEISEKVVRKGRY